MEFIVKKTIELTEREIDEINSLFDIVFEKKRTRREFLNQSVQNPLGYAYHALMVDNDKIVGLNSFIPAYYTVNGEKLLFANSTDSMVSKDHRDFFNFSDMVSAGFKKMKKDGVKFVFGYPNDIAYPVLIKSKLYKDIGKMRTYCLPLHIGGIKKSLKLLNPFTELCFRGMVALLGLFASAQPTDYSVKKEEESYNATRYRRSDGIYNKGQAGHVTFFYKIIDFDGIRTAFLIDVSEKSPKAFNLAIKHIIKHHRKDFDLLLYPGALPFHNTSMIRIPRKFEPKNFNLTGRTLDKKAIDEAVWNIANWDTNLSNYDLI